METHPGIRNLAAASAEVAGRLRAQAFTLEVMATTLADLRTGAAELSARLTDALEAGHNGCLSTAEGIVRDVVRSLDQVAR